MPTELDDFFTAMRDDSNAVPLPPASEAAGRGRRRNRQRAALAGVVAMGLLAAGLAGVALRREPRPDQSGTLIRVGKATIELGEPGARDPRIEIAGGRAFAFWLEADGRARIAAADLGTGQAAWPTRTMFQRDGGCRESPGLGDRCASGLNVQAYPEGLVVARGAVMTRPTKPGKVEAEFSSQFWVLDPATGRTRWEHSGPVPGFGTDWVRVAAGIAMIIGADDVTAKDMATGRTLWRETMSQRERLDLRRAPIRDGSEIVYRSDDGAVSLRDIRTGRVVRTVPGDGGAPSEDGRIIDVDHDRVLWSRYTYSTTRPYQIGVTDLTGSGGSRVVYAGPPGRIAHGAEACDAGLVCVGDLPLDGGTADEKQRIAAVRISDGRELWQLTGRPPAFVSAGRPGRLLLKRDLTRQPEATRNMLYDTATGTSLLDPADSAAPIVKWAGDALLSFIDGHVFRIDTTDGSRRDLGRMPEGAFVNDCVIDTDRMACPANGTLAVFSIEG